MMKKRVGFLVVLLASSLHAGEGSVEHNLGTLAAQLDLLAKEVKEVPVVEKPKSWIPEDAFEGSTENKFNFYPGKLTKEQNKNIAFEVKEFLQSYFFKNPFDGAMFLVPFGEKGEWEALLAQNIDEQIAQLINGASAKADGLEKREIVQAIGALLFYQEFKSPGSWREEFDNKVMDLITDDKNKKIYKELRDLIRKQASDIGWQAGKPQAAGGSSAATEPLAPWVPKAAFIKTVESGTVEINLHLNKFDQPMRTLYVRALSLFCKKFDITGNASLSDSHFFMEPGETEFDVFANEMVGIRPAGSATPYVAGRAKSIVTILFYAESQMSGSWDLNWADKIQNPDLRGKWDEFMTEFKTLAKDAGWSSHKKVTS